MKATIRQLATYLERDGGYFLRLEGPDNVYRIPLANGAGHVDYVVPHNRQADLDAARDAYWAAKGAAK